MYLHACQVRVTVTIQDFVVVFVEDVPLVEIMYLVFTRMPGESYRRRLDHFFVVVFV